MSDGWQCEICKCRGLAINAYFAHLKTHPLGALVERVNPQIAWPKMAIHATWQPRGDRALDQGGG